MAATNPTGKAILRASLKLFRQDRQMIWLPIMATVTSVIVFLAVAAPIALSLGTRGLPSSSLLPAVQSLPLRRR